MDLSRIRSQAATIRAKFEQVKKLDGTALDSTPKGDGMVVIADESRSRGQARFDQDGKPLSFQYEEWVPYQDGYEVGQRTRFDSYSIDHHEESGYEYYFQEVSSDGDEGGHQGDRIAVNRATDEIVGTFSIRTRPHTVDPLPDGPIPIGL